MELKRWDEAAEALDRARQSAPFWWLPHFGRGALEFERGRYEAALPWFVRSGELRPDFADAFGMQGLTLAKLGRMAEARRAILYAVGLGYRAADGLRVHAPELRNHPELADLYRR
jgi:tetratricopeptide (TPR) repeat protein